MKIWKIEQLISHAELISEGRAMKHCVASYAHSCVRGSFYLVTEYEPETDNFHQIVIQLHVESVGST